VIVFETDIYALLQKHCALVLTTVSPAHASSGLTIRLKDIYYDVTHPEAISSLQRELEVSPIFPLRYIRSGYAWHPTFLAKHPLGFFLAVRYV
jgi:hypothetical protein